jgi:cyclase
MNLKNLLVSASVFGLTAMGPLPVEAQGIAYSKIALSTQKVASNLYIITGSPDVDPIHPDAAGGRITALVGEDGVLLVDAQYAPITDKVQLAVRTISAAPVRYVVNTHAHLDHTGGNAAFAAMGAVIVAREETRERMLAPLPAIAGDAAPPRVAARLPTLTFGMGNPMKIRFDGETIDVIPSPAAHTAGDAFVRFENADVLAVGDVYRDYGYPFISTADGGTLKGMLAALDLILATAGPKTTIVPGHGNLAQAKHVVVYRDMIRAVVGTVRQMIAQGRTKDEILRAKVTAAYDSRVRGGQDPTTPGGISSADRFVTEIYSELSNAS